MTPAFLLANSDANFTLAMLLVFGSAKLFAEIFERLSLPGLVGEILAGVLLGPAVLNWIRPSELLSSLAQLGVMFLLFRVGLEVKSSSLMRVGGQAALVAVGGVVLPFFAGWGIYLAWGKPQLESVFIGAAMVATSVGITAQVLAARGLLHLTASKIILAAAVIDDVLGLLVLAVVSGMAKGPLNFFDLGLTAALASAFVLVAALWGSKAMNRVMPRVVNLRVQEAGFTFAVLLLFGLALLASYAGVAAIVGAFLAGMALSESTAPRVLDLTNGASALLLPFFLVGIGLNVSLTPFAQPATLILASVIILAAIASKWLGCGLGAFRLGFAEANRIGAGMIPRGEVGMVVAQIGLTLGAVSRETYAIAVAMAVMTTLIAPLLLKWTFRKATPGQATNDLRLD